MHSTQAFCIAITVISTFGAFCPGAAEPIPTIQLPVRVHLVQSAKEPSLHTTLSEADVRRIFGKVNKIWAQAGIQFQVESIGKTTALDNAPNQKDEKDRWVTASIPPGRIKQNALNVCYVKRVAANGFWSGGLAVVKDTASLKEVPGGLDEPLPRVTSHELGHALGLAHRQDTTNLMASGTTGFSLNEREIRIARARAEQRATEATPSTGGKQTGRKKE